MNLAMVIHGLDSGGAERVFSTLANEWVRRGIQVTVITLSSASEDFYTLDPRVRRLRLQVPDPHGGWSSVVCLFRRIAAIRKCFAAGDFDVVVSFMDSANSMVVFASAWMRHRVVIAERTVPEMAHTTRFWKLLRRLSYPHADVLVVQTEGVRRWAEGFVAKERVIKIANPALADARAGGDDLRLPDGPRILAMGRLVRLKGFDLLIQAFRRQALEFPTWSLCLIGEGSERAALEALTQELGLGGRVTFAGRVKDPARYFGGFEFFVLTSQFEGFPNAMVEAMASGLPALSFDCPYGPREIIRHEVDGLLVPPGDVEALGDAMRRLMKNPEERQRFGVQARQVVERFSMGKVLSEWDRVLTGRRVA